MNEIECPHCNQTQTAEAEELPWDDNDEPKTFNCHHCDKAFLVRASILITHETAVDEDSFY